MKKPIGVFDSGIGGLTVVKAIAEKMPAESIVYYGDTARVPYGPKSKETIQKFSAENTRFLISKDVKAVVVACNTATSYAISYLKRKFDVPVVGVIEPGVQQALAKTRNCRIGVIGTEGTINSRAYEKQIRKLSKDAEIFSIPCPLFVPLVEEGWMDNPVTEQIIHIYLDAMLSFGIDVLILGCTHYPLLKDAIKRVLGNAVTLVDSSEAIVEHLLQRKDIDKNTSERNGRYEFYVSDAPDKFKIIGKRFLEKDLGHVKKIKVWEVVDGKAE